LAAVYRESKPTGSFGVDDHRTRPDRSQDPKTEDDYVRQYCAADEIERVGFRLVDSS
jgi:predicted methyltransferase